jgi:tyrosyl-tRNA synthetase
MSVNRTLPKDDLLRALTMGVADVISERELIEKLALGRPLRVKLGVDPTTPDIHFGHTIGLSKLRQFQDLGHEAVLIIGDFTAMIGDPSGRSVTRPQLNHDQVMANAETYREQAMKILDPEKTRTVFNGEWFELMHFEDVIMLNSRVTLQQMLQREDFRDRIDKGQPVRAHEIQYPIMQGWDSVKIRADIELGGTDQLFNILVGRDLQREEGQPQQVGMLLPILEGLDGVQKMSKSLGNYVGVSEPPGQMFGKIMSISDELMDRWYTLMLHRVRDASEHPMDAKKRLAGELVTRFHSQAAASAALEEFNVRFSKRDLDKADLPVVSLAGVPADIVSVVIHAYASGFNITKSKSDARRLIEQGSIRWRGEKVADTKATPEFGEGDDLKLDKTRAVRLHVS